jgi:peptide/nickel transport system substrate-binding protein
VDRQAIVDGVFFGLGKPVAQYMPPDYWAYDPKVTPDGPDNNYDPEKAKQLLAEAGYPNGVDFEMLVPSLDDHPAVAEALVPMFAAVGLRASTRVIESPTTGVTFHGRQEGKAFPGMGAPFADPTTQYQASLPGHPGTPPHRSSRRPGWTRSPARPARRASRPSTGWSGRKRRS